MHIIFVSFNDIKQLIIQILLLSMFSKAVKGQVIKSKVISIDGPIETMVLITFKQQTKFAKTNKGGTFGHKKSS